MKSEARVNVTLSKSRCHAAQQQPYSIFPSGVEDVLNITSPRFGVEERQEVLTSTDHSIQLIACVLDRSSGCFDRVVKRDSVARS